MISTYPRMLAIACLLALPAQLTAQRPSEYARARDTLRYREITRSESWIRLPQDSMLVPALHDATIAVTFPSRDTARAWYEALVLEVRAPTGVIRPATDSALWRPFVLLFDSRGRVRTLSAPTFPATFEGVSDLSKEFYEFFPQLPTQPLNRGLAWTDTVLQADSIGGRYFRSRIIATHEVAGDTVISERRLAVIRSRQRITYEAGGPVPGQPMRSVSRLSGEASQVAFFDVPSGQFFWKHRSGLLSGTLSYTGGAQPISLPQRYSYDDTVELRP